MLLTEYLNSIENTEQDQLFLQKLSEIKNDIGQAAKMPFIGKLIRALMAMGDSESIKEFKQSEHYENIAGFNITVSDLEKGHFSIYPGAAHGKKIAKVLAIAGAGLLLLWLCRRSCRDC